MMPGFRESTAETLQEFLPSIGEEFEVVGPYSQSLKLRSGEMSVYAAEGATRPFSLIFSGPKTPALEQQIYLLRSQKLGDLEIFLVPISEDSTERRYEAVFN